MITPKEKELVAVGISVAAGCKPCTNYHVKAARENGASDEEIKQVVATALSVRTSATQVMTDHALARVGGKVQEDKPHGAIAGARIKELVSVGAAFAANCVTGLKQHLAAAQNAGISQEEIDQVVKLAVVIKDRAASHVERLAGMREEGVDAKAAASYEEI
ncbi:MAG: carboxymuconolactone decarboxylase family protein [Gammaproteobacteria bacterium]|nr:carboxymuconolactone decarboxylase family protein [Gammaproteobacteria bacterium]